MDVSCSESKKKRIILLFEFIHLYFLEMRVAYWILESALEKKTTKPSTQAQVLARSICMLPCCQHRLTVGGCQLGVGAGLFISDVRLSTCLYLSVLLERTSQHSSSQELCLHPATLPSNPKTNSVVRLQCSTNRTLLLSEYIFVVSEFI